MRGILMWAWFGIIWVDTKIKSNIHIFLLLQLLHPWIIISVSSSSSSSSNSPLTSLALALSTLNIPVANRSIRNGNKFVDGNFVTEEDIDSSLQTIHDVATENLGALCVSQIYRPLSIPLNVDRYEGTRQKVDLAAIVLQDVSVSHHIGLYDALAKGLLSDNNVIAARILATNMTSSAIVNSVWWEKKYGSMSVPNRVNDDGIANGVEPDSNYPWYADERTKTLRSPKFVPSPPDESFLGWWTYPYYSCNQKKWILSYSIAIPPNGRHGIRGFLSIDVDISELQVNQCDLAQLPTNYKHRRKFLQQNDELNLQIEAFHDSHKCHVDSMKCDFRPTNGHFGGGGALIKNSVNSNGWSRGAYQCICKEGFYSERHPDGFNGTIMEVAYAEYITNISMFYESIFVCEMCQPGCVNCSGPAPCLASYNWPFRISILTISILCAIFTIMLSGYMYMHRKKKIFKAASPIFLTITLFGCAVMYLEMAAIFPILDTYSCIATKWTRHMGFCITYTALLMKTWRVSLTYRVKSAHKVKLTDKQLLQWMVPILLVMLIYLGTWTLSAPPVAEEIKDSKGLKFKQCSYNWWDHSLAIGEVLFLAWGIKVCYNVRNAESLYNEARLISYAIYNIAMINLLMVAIHLFIFPQAGPDIKYLLGFVRTQLSTSVTMSFVFGPKVVRVLRGQGDQWDNRAKARGVSASFSLNGIGLVPDDSPDLYQENEELKEEIQKLAAQIEFMKIVNMGMNNRHLKPKPGSYFSISSSIQSPLCKSTNMQVFSSKKSQYQKELTSGGVSEDGSNSVGNNSIGYPSATSGNSHFNDKV